MSGLTPEDEALIGQARIGLEPTGEDHARVRRKVLARVGVGVGAAAATLSATGANASAAVVAGSASAIVFKILGTIAVVGCIAAGTLALRDRRAAPSATPSPAVLTIAQHAENTPPVPVTAVAPPRELNVPPPLPPAPAHVPTPTIVARVPTPRPPSTSAPVAAMTTASTAPSVAPVAASPPSIQSGPATVAQEARLLGEADAALRAGDAARSLSLLDEHAATFPQGVLVEEAKAERVVVLCALGRQPEARQAAAVFLRDHGRSPLVARVRDSCAAP
jgi:hypothetical protein